MRHIRPTPILGQFVQVKRGRDRGQISIISIIDHRFVAIADGRRRTIDRPKKKNVTHIKLLDRIANEVSNSFANTGSVTNDKLRKAIVTFQK